MKVTIYLSIYLFIYLSIYLYSYLYIYKSIDLCLCLSIHEHIDHSGYHISFHPGVTLIRFFKSYTWEPCWFFPSVAILAQSLW